jgi:hypothetical protein
MRRPWHCIPLSVSRIQLKPAHPYSLKLLPSIFFDYNSYSIRNTQSVLHDLPIFPSVIYHAINIWWRVTLRSSSLGIIYHTFPPPPRYIQYCPRHFVSGNQYPCCIHRLRMAKSQAIGTIIILQRTSFSSVNGNRSKIGG